MLDEAGPSRLSLAAEGILATSKKSRHTAICRQKSAEREEILKNVETNTKVESLLNRKASLNGIAITIEEESSFSDMSWGHGYDEIGIVVKGELEIELEKTLYHLYEGDSIFIKQNTPHRYRNPGFTSSLVYWVSSKK